LVFKKSFLSFSDLSDFIFSPEKPEYTKEEGFYFLKDHGTHKKDQAIIYLSI